MSPLPSIAMGFVVIAVFARFGGYDALPDPAGWLLVLLGVRALPGRIPQRSGLLTLAGTAGAVSVALWFPAVPEALLAADPALSWAANLPQLAFCALLAHALGAAAAQAGDLAAAAWLRTARLVVGVAALLPVLVFGAGIDGLAGASYLAATGVLVLLIWLLFTYRSRPWAVDAIGESAANSASSS